MDASHTPWLPNLEDFFPNKGVSTFSGSITCCCAQWVEQMKEIKHTSEQQYGMNRSMHERIVVLLGRSVFSKGYVHSRLSGLNRQVPRDMKDRARPKAHLHITQ